MLIGTAIAIGAASVSLGIAAIIPNNGAENGNLNSWNAVNGFTVGQVDPASGDWHFMGGTQALSNADQTINVPSGLYTSIDQGGKEATCFLEAETWWKRLDWHAGGYTP